MATAGCLAEDLGVWAQGQTNGTELMHQVMGRPPAQPLAPQHQQPQTNGCPMPELDISVGRQEVGRTLECNVLRALTLTSQDSYCAHIAPSDQISEMFRVPAEQMEKVFKGEKD